MNSSQNSVSNPKKVYWILQNNHLTPYLAGFLKYVKENLLPQFEILFKTPVQSDEILGFQKDLGITEFTAIGKSDQHSQDAFERKRDAIGEVEFSEGLYAWRTLVADDLGGGYNFKTKFTDVPEEEVHAVILQIPTPLGSAVEEEHIFYLWAEWANKRKVPLIGYELLPLNTRWTLGAAMVDGVITTSEQSYNYLKDPANEIEAKVWLLPRYERVFFSPATHGFWKLGIGFPEKMFDKCSLTTDKTILYIPQNVAQIYEYHSIMKILTRFGNKIHIMFAIGTDQVRGKNSHMDIIRKIYHNELIKVGSFSFHNLTDIFQICAADGVITAAANFGTMVGKNVNVPTIVFDPAVPSGTDGTIHYMHSESEFINMVSNIIESKQKTSPLKKIISSL